MGQFKKRKYILKNRRNSKEGARKNKTIDSSRTKISGNNFSNRRRAIIDAIP
jgi:hypothetical protein